MLARAEAKDGKALVKFYGRVFRGEARVNGKPPTLDQQMDAANCRLSFLDAEVVLVRVVQPIPEERR